MSTATLSAATAQAQVCLSVAEPVHEPCSRRDEAFGKELTAKQLLQSARCYEQEEGDLAQALKRYEQLMDRTGGLPDDPHQANRIRWKIRRLRLLLGKGERSPATPAAPAVDPPAPQPVEVIADPAGSAAPRTGGAASCGCAAAASSTGGGAAVGAALALAAAALRRRREDDEP